MMHNRRLLFDDDRGVGEALNETDSQGYGMKVNSRYWLNIFDLEHGYSSQRELQNIIDKPVSLFFAKLPEGLLKSSGKADFIPVPKAENSVLASIKERWTYELFGRTVFFPLGKNKILVRLENSADKFDMYTPTIELNMEKFAYYMWMDANPESKTKVYPKIFEMDLTANMFEKEAQWRRKKAQWKGKDDAEIEEMLLKDPELKAVYERDHLKDPITAITLVPQEIRTFVIYYATGKGEEKKFIQN